MQLLENIEVHISERPDLFDAIDIYIVQHNGKDVFLAEMEGELLKFKPLKEGVSPRKATLQIPKSIVQKLIDAFAKAQPPTKQAEVDAELKATKYHLEDLRTLVFKK